MPKQILGKTLYSVLEATQILGLSLVTVRAYIHSGKIESVRLGGRYYIHEETLEKFIAPKDLSQTKDK